MMKGLLFLVGVLSLFKSGFAVIEGPDEWRRQAQASLMEALELQPNMNVAKNVILFLGDGMGLNTIAPSRIYKGQLAGKTGEETQFNFETFPYVALSKTYNEDRQVPDSAGTATAYLCGVKTNYGTIGVNSNALRGVCSTQAGNEVTSILDWSMDEGKAVGVVTTTRITHASPANTYAHSAERYWESDNQLFPDARGTCRDVAAQLVDDNIDINVILGGGRSYLTPNGTYRDPEYPEKTGFRVDGRNLIDEWKSGQTALGRNNAFVWNKDEFDAVDPDTTDYLMGLFEPGHMRYRLDRADDPAGEPTLAEMTEKAIKILRRDDDGYFLFVEGGRIDHGHHAGMAKRALDEVHGLEEAVQAALDLTDDDDTLIIVTADHSHAFAFGGYPARGNPILGDVGTVGFDTEPALDGMPYLTLMYTNGPGDPNRTDLTNVDTTADNYKQPVAVQTNEETHGGEDVAIYARGPMAHLFHGVHEQNYIAHVMAYASCVGQNKDHCSSQPQPTPGCPNGAAAASGARAAPWTTLLLGVFLSLVVTRTAE